MAVPERRTERWHVGKEVPLAVIFAFIVQSLGWLWYVADKSATQTAKLDNLTALIQEFKQQQYTQADARRDMQLISTRHEENRRRIEVLERRLGQ